MTLPPFTQISTNRLMIRAVSSQDLNDLFAINSDDAATKFLPYATWQRSADGTAWLARVQAIAAAGTGIQLVIERNADHKVIGAILLFNFEETSARLEIGYVLGREYWRQGFATEALQAVCQQTFRQLAIRRIEAQVHPDNEASNALLLSLGFVHEGRLRKRWVAKGRTYDINFYGCLAEEWKSDPDTA